MEEFYLAFLTIAILLCSYIVMKKRGGAADLDRSQVEQGRPLDAFETNMHLMGLNGSLLLCNVLFFISKEPISEQTVIKALTRLGQRHPLLRMKVIKSANGKFIFHPASIARKECINYTLSDATNWVQVFEEQLKTPFEEDGLLWRVVALPRVPPTYATDSHPHQTTLALAFNHAIVDGASYCRLFDEMLKDMEAIHTGDCSEVQSQPVPPPLMGLIQMNPPWTVRCLASVLRIICRVPYLRSRAFNAAKWTTRKNPWIAARGEVSDTEASCEYKTSTIPFELDAELSFKLVKACKENGVTMQGAFQVASMAAMAEYLADSPSIDESTTWVSGVTINLRRFISNKEDASSVAPCFGFLSPSQNLPRDWREKFWCLAKDASASLHQNLEAKLKQTRCRRMLSSACGIDIREVSKAVGNGSRSENFMTFTNLGNCNYMDRPSENVIQLRARFGGSAEHGYGHTMASNIIMLQGRICWSLNFYTNVTKREDAEGVAEGIQRVLSWAVMT